MIAPDCPKCRANQTLELVRWERATILWFCTCCAHEVRTDRDGVVLRVKAPR